MPFDLGCRSRARGVSQDVPACRAPGARLGVKVKHEKIGAFSHYVHRCNAEGATCGFRRALLTFLLLRILRLLHPRTAKWGLLRNGVISIVVLVTALSRKEKFEREICTMVCPGGSGGCRRYKGKGDENYWWCVEVSYPGS